MLMKYLKESLVEWIRKWFKENGPDCKAVIGISGGKDSSIVAALCVEALGKDRVIGVMIPEDLDENDIDAKRLIDHLQIENMCIELHPIVKPIVNQVFEYGNWSEQSSMNVRPRLRMSILYAIAQSHNGRVANTCNLSESYIGWETRWGDAVGDFAPLAGLTCSEVIALGKELDLPKELIEKVPADGLCGRSDEEAFGFSYDELDRWIRLGEKGENLGKIRDLHFKNSFKKLDLPHYSPPLVQY